MRKQIFILAALCGLFSICPSFAQNHDAWQQIEKDPGKAGGVFWVYPSKNEIPQHAAAPKGYKPFYISHYGRHGARNASSNSDYELFQKIFSRAQEENNLTATGEDFAAKYLAVYPLLHNHAGELTQLGVQEEHEIASRMLKAYPQVFGKGACVDAVSTTVPRCIMTMAAFCDELTKEKPYLKISQDASRNTMSYLNPFSKYNSDVKATDEGFSNRHAAWASSYADMCETIFTPKPVFARIFKNPSFLQEYGTEVDLLRSFYYLVAAMQCNSDVKDDFWFIFTQEEKMRLWECDSYRYYVSKGPDSAIQGGRQWAFVWTTMQDVLDKADSDFADGSCSVRLRFGHDIILQAIMVLLDAEGWNIAVDDKYKAKDVWSSYWFPMACNIQFIFYRNKAGDVLVRTMYDEQDIVLPIDSECAPYYKWEDFKAFAQKRIKVARNIIANTKAPVKK